MSAIRLAGCVLIGLAIQAQTLEIASIKANRTGSEAHGYPFLRNGTFTAKNTSLKTLISLAYGVSGAQMAGPEWMEREYFDISAKAPEGATNIGPLLQTLLKERFHAVCVVETREIPAYELVAAKGGARLTPFDPAHPPTSPRNTGGAVLFGAGTISQIGTMLAGVLERPVVDKTGIEGRFTYMVRYAPLSTDATASPDIPDIFTAVQQDLGLRLEARKEKLPVVVVEHIDHLPTEN